MAIFNTEFNCEIEAVQYNMVRNIGLARVPNGQVADMAGAVSFFTRMNPDVTNIVVMPIGVSGAVAQEFALLDGAWKKIS